MIKGYGLSSDGGVPASVLSRIEILENNEYKVWYFTSISSTTGTITIPTGATILLDQLPAGADAYVSTISNGQPTGQFPQTAGGAFVDVATFNTSGDYTLTGTPSSFPVALLYVLKIDAKDWSNLTIANIVDVGDYNIAMLGAPLGNDQVVETNGSGKLISAAKGTAYNKNFGTGTANVPEIGATLGNTKTLKTDGSGKLITKDFGDISVHYTQSFFNPADLTTYYFGEPAGTPPTSAGLKIFTVGFNCTLRRVVLKLQIAGAAGTSEDGTVGIRINGVNTNLTTTYKLNTVVRIDTITGLNIPLNNGDNIELFFTTPNYATNPTNANIGFTLYLET